MKILELTAAVGQVINGWDVFDAFVIIEDDRWVVELYTERELDGRLRCRKIVLSSGLATVESVCGRVVSAQVASLVVSAELGQAS